MGPTLTTVNERVDQLIDAAGGDPRRALAIAVSVITIGDEVLAGLERRLAVKGVIRGQSGIFHDDLWDIALDFTG